MSETLLVIAVMISSLALAVHSFAAFGTYRRVKKLQEDLSALVPEVRGALADAQKAMQETTRQAVEIGERTKVILEVARMQLEHFDQARGEVTERMRAQMERLELMLDDSLSRVQEIVSIVHSGVIRPVREVSGVMAGIKTAVQTFIQGRRPSVAQASNDEEFFI